MKTFLSDHWMVLAAIVAIAGVSVLLALRGKKGIAALLYLLVTEAEKIYGSKAGSQKFNYVYENIRAALPAALRPFFSKEHLTAMIETALTSAKERWIKEGGLAEYIKDTDHEDEKSVETDENEPT